MYYNINFRSKELPQETIQMGCSYEMMPQLTELAKND